MVLAERAILAQDWKGDLEESERLYTASLAFHRQAEEPWLLTDGLNNLAVIKTSRGKLDEAIALYEDEVTTSHRRRRPRLRPQVARGGIALATAPSAKGLGTPVGEEHRTCYQLTGVRSSS